MAVSRIINNLLVVWPVGCVAVHLQREPWVIDAVLAFINENECFREPWISHFRQRPKLFVAAGKRAGTLAHIRIHGNAAHPRQSGPAQR